MRLPSAPHMNLVFAFMPALPVSRTMQQTSARFSSGRFCGLSLRPASDGRKWSGMSELLQRIEAHQQRGPVNDPFGRGNFTRSMVFSWISCVGPCTGRSSFAPTIHDHPISSFDPATLAIFEHSTGVRLPPDMVSARARRTGFGSSILREWVDFKCRVISKFVAEARAILKGAKAER